MSEPILLKDQEPDVDPAKIGISYSGGGPLLVVELGIVQAFIDRNIMPSVIAGVSAGAMAGTAHALDPAGPRGVQVGVDVLTQVSNHMLGMHIRAITDRLVLHRQHLTSLGDNEPLKPLIADAISRNLGLRDVTIGTFAPPHHPKLLIGATNRLDGTAVWFPNDTPLEDALVASSAIPGIFPWRTMTVGGQQLTLVDGGVVANQPLSNLVLEGCGTIFACAVGSAGSTVPPPTNALTNAWPMMHVMMHQISKLEEEYVQHKLGSRGRIIHIHPEVAIPFHGFNFTPQLVQQLMAESRAKTNDWLVQQGF